MRIGQGMVAPKIYVIIRIYGVGKGDATGLSVYIDPETLRQKGELDFRTETWAVTPKLAQPPRPGQFVLYLQIRLQTVPPHLSTEIRTVCHLAMVQTFLSLRSQLP